MKSSERRGHAAFTLVELMAVIAIIAILAGLIIGGIGFAKNREATSKAKVQMGRISTALEEYKLAMGGYPASDDTPDGKGQTPVLFNALYFEGAGNTDGKVYLGELDPATSKQGWTSGTASATTKIVDPWGNEYRYRSAFGAAPSGGGAAQANTNTQNPDFDLWSAGQDGKSSGKFTEPEDRDDIKCP